MNLASHGEDSPIAEFYDGYVSREDLPSRSGSVSGSTDRVWPRNNGPAPLSRSTSRSAASGVGGGGSIRRQGTRKGMMQRNPSPQNDEEEYGSDKYDDLMLIRVKVRQRQVHILLSF